MYSQHHHHSGGMYPPAELNDPLYRWFSYVDTDNSGYVNQEELQRALTQSGITGTWRQFSMDTCRLMIAMLDRDNNGTLSYQEFKNLWNALNEWKTVFVRYDRDGSGTIDRRELEVIIKSMGYSVSSQTVNIISKRVDSSREMAFDDFVAAVVKLRAVTEDFRRLDTTGMGSIHIQYDH
eukprot:Ihof_evm3s218 gene=Ihof_evmTU3s218